MSSVILTDNWQNFLYDLEKLLNSLIEVKRGNQKEQKWIFLHLYDVLQGVFIATLSHGNAMITWRGKCHINGIEFKLGINKPINAVERLSTEVIIVGRHDGHFDSQIKQINEIIPNVNFSKKSYEKMWEKFQEVKNLRELWKMIKEKNINGDNPYFSMIDCEPFPKQLVAKAENAIVQLIEIRNSYVHFGYKIWSIESNVLKDNIPICAKILHFLVFKSNALNDQTTLNNCKRLVSEICNIIDTIYNDTNG